MHSLPDPQTAGTVIVGMSGGVDSAVSALLLRDAGFTVQGLFMANWDDEDTYCTAAADFQDARRTCEILDIPLHRVSFAAEYRERVFAHFLREYAAGRTPNPDVLCNREIKFGVCLEYMRRLGATWIATGHYARLRRTAAGVQLIKAADPAKDQSYFLHQVAPAALARTLFPIGDLRKDEVRRRAHAAGLPVFDKPDSTGICFVGERPFAEFLSTHLHQTPGPIENAEGTVIGEHRGLATYTLGQRSGLHIGGRADAAAAPWFVAAKDQRRNALIVVQDPGHPLLLSDSFEVEDLHWLEASLASPATAFPTASPAVPATAFPMAPAMASPAAPATAVPIAPAMASPAAPATAFPIAAATASSAASPTAALDPGVVGVKTRYRQNDLPCELRIVAGTAHVTLKTPARSVTPGQYAVFYSGERCLGGGVIAQRRNSHAAQTATEAVWAPAAARAST